MIAVDTYADHKAIIEASYMNIPVIALANSDSNLQYVDCAIPCNNKSTQSIAMVFWLLAREVRVLNGQLNKNEEWDVMVDLFYYKTVEDQEKNELKEVNKELEDKDKAEGNWDQGKNDNDDDAWNQAMG